MKVILALSLSMNVTMAIGSEKADFYEVTAYPKSMILQDNGSYLVQFSDLATHYFANKKLANCLSTAIQNTQAVVIKHHKKTLIISECKLK